MKKETKEYLESRINFDILIEKGNKKPSEYLIKSLKAFIQKPTYFNFINTGRFMTICVYREMNSHTEVSPTTENIVKYGGDYIIEVMRGRKGDAFFKVNNKRYKSLERAEKEMWEKIIQPLIKKE
jgi:hypothetical protein